MKGIVTQVIFIWTGPEAIKEKLVLNSDEHEILSTHKYKNIKNAYLNWKMGLSLVVVGRLIELVDHFSLRAIRVDHR